MDNTIQLLNNRGQVFNHLSENKLNLRVNEELFRITGWTPGQEEEEEEEEEEEDEDTKAIGTLSKDDDDGSENDVKKMNLRSFKLNRVYLDPLNMSNAGDFSWSLILKDVMQGPRPS